MDQHPVPELVGGRYRVVSRIGSGGMGVVYKATDTKLGRQVAIKAIRSEKLGDEHARLSEEARAAASLDHPYLCKVYELLEDGDDVYLVMEFVDGETLSAVLARGSLPLERTLAIGAELAEGLATAHARGLVHSDIKPANVMVGPDGHVKLLDFGLARPDVTSTPTEATHTSANLTTGREGTPRYMAPEQVRGAPVTARTDEYALGVVLYQCVSGRLPFSGDTGEDYMAQSLVSQPTPLTSVAPDVPVDLARLIHHCLEKTPANRPESANHILDELRRISDAAGTLLTVRAIRRRRMTRTVAAAGLLALVFLGWSLWFQPAFTGIVGQHRAVVTGVVTGIGNVEVSRVSPDGGWLLFRAWKAGRLQTFVQALDAADRNLAATPVDHPDGARWFTWSPNSRELAYVLETESGELFQTIPAFFGGRPRLNIAVERLSRILRWIDDDTVMLRRRTSAGPALSRLTLSTGATTPVNLDWLDLGTVQDIAISQTGDRMAYTTLVNRRVDLWAARLDGSDRRQLTDDEAREQDPVWNADSRSVIYESNRNGQADLWEVDIRSGQSVPLTRSDTVDTPGSMSTDGRFLSFSREAVDAQIWRWPPGDAIGQPLTSSSLGSFSPSLAGGSGALLLQRGEPVYAQGSALLNSSLMLGELRPETSELQLRSVADGFAGFLSPNGQRLSFLRRNESTIPSILFVKELGTELTVTVSTSGPLPAYREFPVDWAEQAVAWHPDSGSLFYSEGQVPGPITLRQFRPSDGPPGKEIDSGGEREFFRDLYPTPDGRGLGYLFWSRGEFLIRYYDFATGTHSERGRVSTGTAFARGWIDAGRTFVVLRSVRAGVDGSGDFEVLLVNAANGMRVVRTVGSAYISTARLDPVNRTLYVTRSIDGVHNVFIVPLDGAPEQALTRNTVEGPTFSAVSVAKDGSVIGVRGTKTHNIWVIDTTPDNINRSSR